jgi:hypothetical protein
MTLSNKIFSQELGVQQFVKLKTEFFLSLAKASTGAYHPLGILLYNCHYVIVACAFTLQELNETLECIIPFVYHLEPI